MVVRIRKLGIEDYEALIELWKKAGLPHRPQGRDSKKSIRLQIGRDAELLGAFVEGKLAGVVIGTFDGRRGWVNRLAVDPSHRRTGVGTALLTGLERVLRKKGARLIGSHVDADNAASLALFEKNGYKIHRDMLYLSKRDSDQV